MRKNAVIKTGFFVAAISILLSASTFASDDNIFFSGTVKAYGANTRFPKRYRETNMVEEPWKVQLVTSEEGKGTITTFWLENFYTDNVSADVYAKQGGPVYYNNPYESANRIDNYLTMENNNFNGNTYKVTGYWDEETWD